MEQELRADFDMQQCLVARKGPPASGTSMIGRALSRALKWPMVDKDEVQEVLGQMRCREWAMVPNRSGGRMTYS